MLFPGHEGYNLLERSTKWKIFPVLTNALINLLKLVGTADEGSRDGCQGSRDGCQGSRDGCLCTDVQSHEDNLLHRY